MGAGSTAAEDLLVALDDVPLGVASVDRTWTCRYANTAALALLQQGEDVVGRDLRELGGDGLLLALGPACARVMDGGDVEVVEGRFGPRDVLARARVLPSSVGIVVLVDDARQQVRSESPPPPAFDLCAQLLDHAPTAISLLGLDERYRLANRQAADLLGHSVEEVLDHSPEELVDAEIAAALLQAHRDACGAGAVVRPGVIESWQADRGRNVLCEVFPVYDTSRRLVGSGAAVTDITELVRAEADREAAQQRYRAVFTSSTLGQLVARMPEGALVEANAAMCRLLGYSRAELMTMRARDLVADEAVARAARLAQVRAEGELGYETEDVLVRSDGQELPVLMTMNLLPQAEGEPQLLLMIIRDQTREKEWQRQLVVAERVEAASQVAAGVAHDANNLLMAVAGYAEMLSAEVTSTAGTKHLAGMHRLIARARDMTAGLTEFAGGQHLEPTDLDLAELVQNSLDMLRHLLPNHVRLHLVLAPAVAVVDATQAGRVLLNLVLNARDALRDGGRLEVSTSLRAVGHDRTLPPGLFAVLSVRDDGEGMPESVLRRCFEPFFTTRQEGGSGLGLSTSHGIARQSGGDLRAASTPSAGSLFELLLPAAGGQTAAQPAETPVWSIELAGLAAPHGDA